MSRRGCSGVQSLHRPTRAGLKAGAYIQTFQPQFHERAHGRAGRPLGLIRLALLRPEGPCDVKVRPRAPLLDEASNQAAVDAPPQRLPTFATSATTLFI